MDYIQAGRIKIHLSVHSLSLKSVAQMKEITRLQPLSIYWSNILDYMPQKRIFTNSHKVAVLPLMLGTPWIGQLSLMVRVSLTIQIQAWVWFGRPKRRLWLLFAIYVDSVTSSWHPFRTTHSILLTFSSYIAFFNFTRWLLVKLKQVACRLDMAKSGRSSVTRGWIHSIWPICNGFFLSKSW